MIRQRLVVLTLSFVVALAVQSARAEDKKKDNRLFELRTYTTHEGKLKALHARFRDHTNAIFKSHGMQLVGYWTPTDKKTSENTLVYILAYPNMESRTKAWRAFLRDPKWQKAFKASRKDGPIVKKVTSQFLSPTDYSPIK